MNIFVITSILNPKIGLIDTQTRYTQTLKTIQSIKDRVPGSIIIMIDSSAHIEEEKVTTIKSQVNYFISLANHKFAQELNDKGLKSQGECYIMIIALDVIRNLGLADIKRVFKITGRAELTDNFKIEDYDNPEMKGKYVFKTPVVSWMSQHLKLVDTRLWSFDYNLLDDVEGGLIRPAYEETMQGRFDLEHTYYKLLPKDLLFGKDVIGLTCQLASCGTIINE
jgi:hypothetical protein